MELTSKYCWQVFAGRCWACPTGGAQSAGPWEAEVKSLLLIPREVPVCVCGRVLGVSGRAGRFGAGPGWPFVRPVTEAEGTLQDLPGSWCGDPGPSCRDSGVSTLGRGVANARGQSKSWDRILRNSHS